MSNHKILVVNLGSTSSKVAYYIDDKCEKAKSIEHDAETLKQFGGVQPQIEYRYEAVLAFLEDIGVKPAELSAVVSRGGHTEPIVGGVYRIDEEMLGESMSQRYGFHACDLGLQIAYKMSREGSIPLTVDPPVTCEFEPLSFYSGLPEIRRKSSFHVLNHRAAAKQYARDIDKPYENLRLVVIHMGGGISVAAHKEGKLVDANNALTGDGPFSTNRTGGLPVGSLIDMCYSGDFSHDQMMKKINGQGGLVAYVNETDVKTLEQRAKSGDTAVEEALAAMCYQIAKEIGSYAATLKGKIDAILFTGGISKSEYIIGIIREYISFIAPIVLYPGEFEMQALAQGAYEVLSGKADARVFREGKK